MSSGFCPEPLRPRARAALAFWFFRWAARALGRRSGLKRIFASDDSKIVPTSKLQPHGTLVKALACAWRSQRLLAGVYTSVSDIGDAENISNATPLSVAG
jgi:hypothetical protein